MNKLQKNILDISSNNYESLISLKNVHGIGLGYKWINKKNTFEPCIHVLVNKKIDIRYIDSTNIIPKTFMGIKTDVIETGQLKFCSGNASIKERYRPLQGGCNISIEIDDDIYDGTLGCIVTKIIDGVREFFILSNNHIMANLNEAPIGTPIFQANYLLDSKEEDIVATLTDFIPLKFISKKSRPINYVDCAIAKISNTNLISNKIYTLGEIKGIGKISLNMPVRKVGFISGLTEGYIITKYVTKFLRVDSKRKLFFQNLILTDLKTSHGDSGSIVVNTSNEVLGLFLGGTDNLAYMQDINTVLSKLNISIYTC